MTTNLLYRFPSSHSSSSIPEARHSWPTSRHAHQPQSFTENIRSEPGREVSVSSFGSFESSSSNSSVLRRQKNENVPPLREASFTSHLSARDTINPTSAAVQVKASQNFVRKTNIEVTQNFSPSNSSTKVERSETKLSAGCGQYEENPRNSITGAQPRLSFDVAKRDTLSISHRSDQTVKRLEADNPSIAVSGGTRHPLKRLMNSVRRKSPNHRASLKIREERWSLDDIDRVQTADGPFKPHTRSTRHSKSSSWSSSGIATAVKSATTNLIIPYTKRPIEVHNSKRSNPPNTANKPSSDSSQESTRIVDEAAWNRARQRRGTLEELIVSEESYVADLKVLVNVSK